MAEPTIKRCRIHRAAYIDTADAILLLAECEEGMFRTQIPSSSFTFGDKDKAFEMRKLAEIMIDKEINLAFDTDLIDKLDVNAPLNYPKK